MRENGLFFAADFVFERFDSADSGPGKAPPDRQCSIILYSSMVFLTASLKVNINLFPTEVRVAFTLFKCKYFASFGPGFSGRKDFDGATCPKLPRVRFTSSSTVRRFAADPDPKFQGPKNHGRARIAEAPREQITRITLEAHAARAAPE